MLGFYNYTVYLTYVGLVSAMTGVFFSFAGKLKMAVICLLISGACDMFDGKIARTKKDRTEDEKRFGIQIDSLCDIVCFGVLPAVISFPVGATSALQVVVAALFTVCGVIRLAYFNVTEEVRQTSTTENRKLYSGMPITSTAIIVPLTVYFSKFLGNAFPTVYTSVLAVCGILFITPISIKKPGKAGTLILTIFGVAVLVLLLSL